MWRGTNDNVIEVSQDGTIVAKAIGDATVRVFVGETVAVCEVHVVTGVQQVVFNTGSMEMKCGNEVEG